MDAIQIRVIKPSDLDDVATVHCAAFQASAMTQLGRTLVRRYYQWQLEGPHETYAHGAWNGHRLIGFCFGGVHPEAISGFFTHNKSRIALEVIKRPWLLGTPIFRSRIGRAIHNFRSLGRDSNGHTVSTVAEAPAKMPYDILSMAVLPDTQGTGVGKLLMNAAEGTARERGFSAMTLCVNIDNERGIRFYESCGWHKTQSMEGMWCMEKHFVPEAGPQGVHPASPHAATVRE